MPFEEEPLNLPEELSRRRQIILRELKKRVIWFIQLRWLVPPSLVLGVVMGWLIPGISAERGYILLIALFILTYNVGFYAWNRWGRKGVWKTESLKRFAYGQVILDYLAVFLLIHVSGGAASPFIFFFIFHVIFAAILLPSGAAYAFAGLAALGMAGIATAEYLHWLSPHPIYFQGRDIDLARQPFHMLVELSFFTASVFITAYSTTTIMPIFRKRITNLAELSEAVVNINSRLNALYVITKTISSVNRFEQVLEIVTSELAAVMKVKGISIKLLSEDGKLLRYAAAYGLPAHFKDRVVEVEKSPLNRRIIQGEPYVIGRLTRQDMFQFGEDLTAAGIRSVLFVPLSLENKVIGILGAYGQEEEKFGVDELDFFRLAAGLVAVALENARAFESIEKLNKERLWFMMKVAHNLRSPLTTNQSIINLLQEGYLGELNPQQKDYLARISERSNAMIKILNELLTLAETRNLKQQMNAVPLDLKKITERIYEMFQPEAAKKQITFTLTSPPELPSLKGDAEMITQMLENLVSNAIKYTPPGGQVSLKLSREGEAVQLSVQDTGIGIPEEAKERLFTEFFRAENAKQVEEIGTGLGLCIVRDIVREHGGTITAESKENQGSTFTVTLPLTPTHNSQ